MGKGAEGWGKIRDKELRGWYYSSNIIRRADQCG
jgi:hypothetical protein